MDEMSNRSRVANAMIRGENTHLTFQKALFEDCKTWQEEIKSRISKMKEGHINVVIEHWDTLSPEQKIQRTNFFVDVCYDKRNSCVTTSLHCPEKLFHDLSQEPKSKCYFFSLPVGMSPEGQSIFWLAVDALKEGKLHPAERYLSNPNVWVFVPSDPVRCLDDSKLKFWGIKSERLISLE